MGLFDIFKKKEESKKAVPLSVNYSFVPVRLAANKSNSTDLHVKVKNLGDEAVLASLVVSLPKGLGIDQTGITRTKELRLGYLGDGEERDFIVPVWANVTTDPGELEISINALCHYRTYSYVLNSVKKNATIRVV